jgi:hypothetical protein
MVADVSGWGQTASERAQRPAREQMGDAARQGMDQARDAASSLAQQAGEAWRNARDAAPQYAGRAGEIARDVYGQGQQLARQVGGQVQEPWMALLAGIAVGYLIGYVVHGR